MKPLVVSTFATDDQEVYVLYRRVNTHEDYEQTYYELMRIGSDTWESLGTGARALAERVDQLEKRLATGPTVLHPIGPKPDGYGDE